MNYIIIRTCAVKLTAASKPPAPWWTRWLKIGPGLLIAVVAIGISEIRWPSLIWGLIMSLKDTHVRTVRLLCIAVVIILKQNIIKETLGVIGHLIANNIKASISLAKWKFLTAKRSTHHAYCIASLTVTVGCVGVARFAGWSGVTCEIWVIDIDGVVWGLMSESESDTSLVIG